MRVLVPGTASLALGALLLLLPAAGLPAAGTASRAAADVHEVEVTLRRFAFSPDRIIVPQGTPVRILARSADVAHGLEIKRLGIDYDVPRGGEPVVIEFVAEHAGVFEIACSEYCGSGHRRMKGLLVVEPAAGETGRETGVES